LYSITTQQGERNFANNSHLAERIHDLLTFDLRLFALLESSTPELRRSLLLAWRFVHRSDMNVARSTRASRAWIGKHADTLGGPL